MFGQSLLINSSPVVPVTTNLYTYVSMVDTTSRANFTTGSGSSAVTWVDISGNNNDWIVNSGGWPLSVDLANNNFDKTLNNKVNTSSSSLTLGGDYTIEEWINPGSATYIAGPCSDPYTGGFITYIDGGGNTQLTSYPLSGGADYGVWTYTIPSGSWVQVVWINDNTSGEKKLYVNGVQVSTTWTFTAGSMSGGGTFAFVLDVPWVNSSLGEIGIIRIYSDVLTAAEVLQNYKYNKADYGLP